MTVELTDEMIERIATNFCRAINVTNKLDTDTADVNWLEIERATGKRAGICSTLRAMNIPYKVMWKAPNEPGDHAGIIIAGRRYYITKKDMIINWGNHTGEAMVVNLTEDEESKEENK